MRGALPLVRQGRQGPIDCSPENLGPFRWITAPGVRPGWLVALFGNVPPEFVGSTARPLKAITGYLGAVLGRGTG